MSAPRPSEPSEIPKRSGKYIRAKWRHFMLTVTANRLTGGELLRRHAAQRVEERAIEVCLPRWPIAFDGVRIAHLSDLHVGHLMTPERAVAVVESVAAIGADLVVCTGDVVDLDAEEAEPVLAALGRIAGPLGSLLVLGNHDHLDDPKRVVRVAEANGVNVLMDEAVMLGNNGARLHVGGVDWARTIRASARRVAKVWQKGRGLDLLLAHNPKAFVHAAKLGVPLTLSGHTHGRQFALRRRNPATPSFARRLNAGLYSRGESALFVTVGLGAWFPLRVNCPPEIAVLTVRRG
ncbi:MAG: metallophosphoesterase family protein [Phycisphaerae bacterium]|nr:metallophosphoesterase family protein [Phycisphaerae bacterium]